MYSVAAKRTKMNPLLISRRGVGGVWRQTLYVRMIKSGRHIGRNADRRLEPAQASRKLALLAALEKMVGSLLYWLGIGGCLVAELSSSKNHRERDSNADSMVQPY